MSETTATTETVMTTYHDANQAQAAMSAADKPVLLQFSADWCGPCRRMSPVVDKVTGVMTEQLAFFRINVDENEQMSQSLSVKGIPHFILMKGGEVADRWAGAQPESEFLARIESNL